MSYDSFLDSFRIVYAQVPDCVCYSFFTFSMKACLNQAIPKLLFLNKLSKLINF